MCDLPIVHITTTSDTLNARASQTEAACLPNHRHRDAASLYTLFSYNYSIHRPPVGSKRGAKAPRSHMQQHRVTCVAIGSAHAREARAAVVRNRSAVQLIILYLFEQLIAFNEV